MRIEDVLSNVFDTVYRSQWNDTLARLHGGQRWPFLIVCF